MSIKTISAFNPSTSEAQPQPHWWGSLWVQSQTGLQSELDTVRPSLSKKKTETNKQERHKQTRIRSLKVQNIIVYFILIECKEWLSVDGCDLGTPRRSHSTLDCWLLSSYFVFCKDCCLAYILLRSSCSS